MKNIIILSILLVSLVGCSVLSVSNEKSTKVERLLVEVDSGLLTNPQERLDSINLPLVELSKMESRFITILPDKPQKKETETPIKKDYTKKSFQAYAVQEIVSEWDSTHIDSFFEIVHLESKWDPNAQNPYSTAYGIGQFLNSTWKTVRAKKTSDGYLQIDYMLQYIKQRYKNPKAALRFKKRTNWY